MIKFLIAALTNGLLVLLKKISFIGEIQYGQAQYFR
jgi:hypothetical protein